MAVGEDDAQYLRGIQEALNSMIQSGADAPERSYSEATTYVACPSTPRHRSIRTSVA
mgnify:CR=1 FL=1